MPIGIYKRPNNFGELVSKGRRRKLLLRPIDKIRTCIKCNKIKDLEYFRKNKNSWQGRTNECKQCAVKRNKKVWNNWFRKNKEIYNEKYVDIIKKKARNALGKAVFMGKIIKGPCIVCRNYKTQGHHDDYSKPLEVIWLCSRHHYEKHN